MTTSASSNKKTKRAKRNSFQNIDRTYQTVSARRLQYESLMWQVPALSLSAQAFLLSIALGSSTADIPRQISSALACLVAVISMHLLAKHRYLEELEAKTLHNLEHKLNMLHVHSTIEHRLEQGYFEEDKPNKMNWFVKYSGYRMWMRTLGVFAIAALAIVVASMQGLDVF